MKKNLIALVLALLVTWPVGAVHAQQAIAVGGRINGRLAAGDTQTDGRFEDRFVLRGAAGAVLRIRLDSAEFDPVLMIEGPGGFTARNDDANYSNNAELGVVLPAAGEYRIIAASYIQGAGGAYTLTVEEQAIRLGETVRGELINGDAMRTRNQRQDVYLLRARANQRARMLLRSEHFDPHLIVTGPNGFRIENQDSNISDTQTSDSEIDFVFPQTGDYLVIVSSETSSVSNGQYELTTREGSAVAPGRIRLGETVSGALQDGDLLTPRGKFEDVYLFEGQAGQRLTLSMRTDQFRPALIVNGPGGYRFDDNYSNRGEERIEITLPATGTYRISASSNLPVSTGPYTLQALATEGPPPPEPRVISFGDIAGELAPGDARRRPGPYYEDVYRLRLRANQSVIIEMRAQGYVPAVRLVGPNETPNLRRAGNDERIEFTSRVDAEYQIHASASGDDTGPYTLSVRAGRQAQANASSGPTPIARTGATFEGALTAEDARNGDRREDIYVLEGRAGDRVRVAMRQADFYPRITVRGPNGFEQDDFEGSVRSLEMDVVLPAAGRYEIVASGSRLGRYTISVDIAGAAQVAGNSPAANSAAAAQTIALGAAAQGSLQASDTRLATGHYADRYAIAGRANQWLDIAVTSQAFDTRVMLMRADALVAENDDDPQTVTLNSRLVVRLPSDGAYTILVSSAGPGAEGAYALTLREGQPPPRPRASREGLTRMQERGALDDVATRAMHARIERYFDRRDQIAAAVDEDNASRQETLLRAHVADAEELWGTGSEGYSEQVLALASHLEEQGRRTQAIMLLRETLATQETIRGGEHAAADTRERLNDFMRELKDEMQTRTLMRRAGIPGLQ